ncbi:ABC transporter ATP-binding protein [Paracoccus laeviglucosivorans]|uniref:Carbohydrate ABC transporter ATP-binding protein, CUT1 family n=1 Tax=Paracoccus laeviglucosivorans TaxID=1197861 RepID=A0A521BAC1_9RHOB|nr:ABC transporter ATP-binding protein [Paracoccus laeviglucosivorans]SMO44015.1 carbohydrate ABC transporter ATP-binding protein, CUT1 family [Paracoccus laeviglucosivorans]
MIRIDNLTKTYGTGPAAVDGLTFDVPQGAFLVLLGPSGCGKSTMLRMLAGLEQPSAGQIRFGDTLVADGARGYSMAADKRGAGLVFQSYALWPHMTVAGNVDWPLKVAGLDAPTRRTRVTKALETVGIAPLAARYPAEISGGQQQRVALARMIAPRPRIMLFDEPLSNLDATLRVEMRHELARLHRATGATAVYVTHDQVEAMTLATHVAVMRAGRIEQFGPPADLLEAPQTAFVAGFVGTPPANLVAIRDGAWFGRLPDPALRGATGHAMVRAQEFGLTQTPGPRTVPAERIEVVPMAGRLIVTVQAEAQRLTVITDPETPVPATAHLELPAAPAALFDPQGNLIP